MDHVRHEGGPDVLSRYYVSGVAPVLCLAVRRKMDAAVRGLRGWRGAYYAAVLNVACGTVFDRLDTHLTWATVQRGLT